MNVLRMLIGVAALLACASILADEAKAASSAAPAAASVESRDCLRDTGTRIRRRDGECSGAPGRAITREDIDNSGAANVGDALRTLDPRVGLRR